MQPANYKTEWNRQNQEHNSYKHIKKHDPGAFITLFAFRSQG